MVFLSFIGSSQPAMEGMGSTLFAPLLGGFVATAVVTTMLVKRGLPTILSPQPDGALESQKKKRRISRHPSYPNGKLDVWFGSQSGTAESFAKTLAREAAKHGYDAKALDMDDFVPEDMVESEKAVFIVATYGEGEPPDNARAFDKWVKDEANPGLSKMQFAVFGLGSSQYEYYNQFGKDLDRCLAGLGAQRMLPLGLGDAAQPTFEEDFETWTRAFWCTLAERSGPAARDCFLTSATTLSSTSTSTDLPDLPFKLALYPSSKDAPPQGRYEDGGSSINTSTKHFFEGHAVEVPVMVNRELRSPADGGSTRHIEIDISATSLKYTTADTLAVLPHNSTTAVSALATAMGYDLDATMIMEGPKAVFPTPCTVREALTKYVDIMSIPRRSLVAQLALFAQDSDERSRLLHLSSTGKEGQRDYHSYVDQGGRSLLELMTSSFPSIRLPLDQLINLAPPLQPRYYTISSSSTVHPTTIHITVAVATTTLPDGRIHHGVCSTYLSHLTPSSTTSTVRVFVRPSTFRLPKEPSTPIIMIGPGTGIAPMRAMLQERLHTETTTKQEVGEAMLFFGCRRRDHDFIYREELAHFENEGAITDLQLAFSREGGSKVYVQHLMAQPEKAAKLCRLICEEGAYVYVCGATTMGKDVSQALLQVLRENGEKPRSVQEASDMIKRMQEQGRYVQELWSA